MNKFALVIILFANQFLSAQNTDKEKLMNVQHAFDNYHDCNATIQNLNKISTAGRSQSKYLLYLGKYFDECLSKYDSAIVIYELYLQKNPSDVNVSSRISSIKHTLEQAEKKKTCYKCKGSGYYMGKVKCGECNGLGKGEAYQCRSCDGTGEKECSSCSGSGEKSCNYCRGYGYFQNGQYCGNCRGTGKRDCSACRGEGERKCFSCGGSGRKRDSCRKCRGTGQVDKEQRCNLHD